MMTNRICRLLAVAGALACLLPSGLARAAEVPFSDLGSVGGLALCDAGGHRVTGGNVTDRPFVALAVSTVATPTPYGGPGRAAALYAYQPRQDAYPDQWNGQPLTAASEYPAGKLPAVAGTRLDRSLEKFLVAFPARWDHLVELRLFWGARGVGYDGRRYSTAVLKVEGGRWRLVSAPGGNCAAAHAVSTEITVAHLDPNHPKVGLGTNAQQKAAAANKGIPSLPITAPGQPTAAATATSAAPRSRSASWSQVLGWGALVVAALAVGICAVTVIRRRWPRR